MLIQRKKTKWDQYFLDMCELTAAKSKDASTKVGAVVVGADNQIVSVGYNGFPRMVNDDIDERHERPAKYMWTEHAERNAIYNAARTGVSLKDCTLYLNFKPFPCSDCARGVIQSGIKTIIGNATDFPGKGEQWEQSLKIAQDMCSEAGVTMIIVTD